MIIDKTIYQDFFVDVGSPIELIVEYSCHPRSETLQSSLKMLIGIKLCSPQDSGTPEEPRFMHHLIGVRKYQQAFIEETECLCRCQLGPLYNLVKG